MLFSYELQFQEHLTASPWQKREKCESKKVDVKPQQSPRKPRRALRWKYVNAEFTETYAETAELRLIVREEAWTVI